MKFYFIEPEIGGLLGENTQMDRTLVPPLVHHLHYEFDTWLGDELLGSLGGYIVTESLGEAIERNGLTGAVLDEVEVSCSDAFHTFHSDRALPEFRWLRITGMPGRDDFGMSSDGRLVLSEHALDVVKAGRLDHCEITEFP